MKRTLILSISLSIVWQLTAFMHTGATNDDAKSEKQHVLAALSSLQSHAGSAVMQASKSSRAFRIRKLSQAFGRS
jgi:hypothetical protein